MKLSDLKLHSQAIIKKIQGEDDLKTRLHSLGIFEESIVSIKNIFIAKQTIQLENEDGTMVALRLCEANKIFVELTDEAN